MLTGDKRNYMGFSSFSRCDNRLYHVQLNVAKHVKGVTDDISNATKQEPAAPKVEQAPQKKDTLKDLDNFNF